MQPESCSWAKFIEFGKRLVEMRSKVRGDSNSSVNYPNNNTLLIRGQPQDQSDGARGRELDGVCETIDQNPRFEDSRNVVSEN